MTEQPPLYTDEISGQPHQEDPVPAKLRDSARQIICINCNTEQTTIMRRKIGIMNWMVCGLVAYVFCILGPFCLIPFCCIPLSLIACCIGSLKDVEHVCPNCNVVNGTYRRWSLTS